MSSRVVLAGAGYVGLHVARRLEHRASPGEVEVTLVNPENFMTYRPLLPEVAAGTLEPRHAVVPLRTALRHADVLTGRVAELSAERRQVGVATAAGEKRQLDYDHLVVALGAASKTLPVPGLAEHAIGFTSLAEAGHLRDHVLHQLEAAAASTDDETRRRALTFVVIGGGYTGVEALAELQDMAAHVVRGYRGIGPKDLRWTLVEATDRLLPTVSRRLAGRALAELRGRGVDVRLRTTLDEAGDRFVRLSDGETLPTGTLVWVAGVTAHPDTGALGLPLGESGRLDVDECMRVPGLDGVWAAGDCAAVPNTMYGQTSPPTAQHAVRQGHALGDNILAAIRGGRPSPFSYRSKGEFVTLGRHRGVAEVYGLPVSGVPAWAARRAYYASQIPTVNRKLRAILDWVVGLPFGHDAVDLGSRERPHAAFDAATRR